MTTEPRVTILGATGPVGKVVASIALSRGHQVTAVSRSARKLELLAADLDGPLSTVSADLTNDRKQITDLIRNSDAVILAAGVDPAHLEVQVSMARTVAQASPSRLVYVSSCWSYSPLVSPVLDETHPRHGEGGSRYRAQAEDIVADAGGVVLHLPDFYGPGVHTSPLQRVIALGLARKLVTWPARRDIRREHIYVPDIGPTVMDAAWKAPAGSHFVVPGSGPITFEGMVSVLARVLGREVRSLALGSLPVGVLRVIDPWSRHLGDAVTEYRKAIEYDGSLLKALIGTGSPTPYERGVAATVRWMMDAA